MGDVIFEFKLRIDDRILSCCHAIRQLWAKNVEVAIQRVVVCVWNMSHFFSMIGFHRQASVQTVCGRFEQSANRRFRYWTLGVETRITNSYEEAKRKSISHNSVITKTNKIIIWRRGKEEEVKKVINNNDEEKEERKNQLTEILWI